ncbi:MAG: ABC transporter permease, partial [Deltaproteobacteria bacterium]|nr:ABC transporter permease [Deltaproteobacteria bacterium]
MEISISSLIAAIAVMAAPLVLASLGETLTEKVG